MKAEDDPLYWAMLNDGIIVERHGLAESTWDGAEIEAACAVLRSGQTTMGVITREYERRFATYVGTRYAVACNSGSSANLLMVAALSSGLVFGTRGAFADREPQFRDFFGIDSLYRAPNGSTNFSVALEDTVSAAVHPGLDRFRFLSLGLRAIMECFASRRDAATRRLYFYPESTFVRATADTLRPFVNPVQFDIGVQHDLGGGASTAYVSFPIGLPINSNTGVNEIEIREVLRLVRILEP